MLKFIFHVFKKIQYVIDKGFTLNRQEAIIETNDGPVYWCIDLALRPEGLKALEILHHCI